MIDHSQIIGVFARDHHLSIPTSLAEDAKDLAIIIFARRQIETELTLKAQDLVESREPTWAITRTMLDRVYEQLEGAFIALFTGSWATVEVICRATLEAAVNVLYVLQKDTPRRLSQYLLHYFDKTRTALDKLERLDPLVVSQSREINDAREILGLRKELLGKVLALDGIPLDANGWPNTIAQIFTAVGKELEYREIYATLSSQTHSDADALVDYVLMMALKFKSENSVSSTATELLFWLRFFITRTAEMYLDTAIQYSKKYGLTESGASVTKIRALSSEKFKRIQSDFLSVREHRRTLLTSKTREP